jgi:tetratricopeptide (TPR) repeat protein
MTETRPGVILGTAGFMSPEQVRGANVDFRSDQFSFGSVLYEMATGKMPFVRETSVQTMAAIIEDEPPSIDAINQELPPPFLDIVRRCMAKNPEDRYASTQELALELRSIRDRITAETHFLEGLPTRKRPRHSRLAIMSAIAAAVAVIVIGVPTIRERLPGPADIALLPVSKQLAILPFVNVGNDAANESFCDGLVETLTSKLTQLEPYDKLFRIVPSSEVRRESVTSARDALKSFGATLVITGSIQRIADRVRVTINLVDSKTQRQVAAKSIDTEIGDVSTMQDGIVIQTAELLGIRLSGQQRQILVAGGTTVPGALEFYLEGQGYLQRYDNAENIDRAIRLLSQAVERDPRYALAHAALGQAYWRKYELIKDASLIELARKSCDAAMRINDRLASLYITLALISNGTGRHDDAIRYLQRALDLDPVSADAYRELAAAYVASGKSQEAEATYKKAIEARPSYWAGYNELGTYYFRLGRYTQAEEQFRRLLDLTPDSYRAYSNLGGVYYATGRYDDAASMFEKSIAIKPSGSAYSNLGTVYFYLARYGDAVQSYEQALKVNDRDYRLWKNLATAYYWMPDQRNQAADRYRRAAALAEEQRKVNPRNPRLLLDLADCYSMLGETRRARDLLQQALNPAPGNAAMMFDGAVVYEQLGNRERALEWLDKALRLGYSRDLVQRAPSLAQLRGDPRFGK